MHGVEEDLAEASSDRPHFGLDAVWQLRRRLLQPLVDEIAGEVDVGAVLEHDRYLRKPVTGQGSRVLDVWQPRYRRFHEIRDALLYLER